MVGTLAVQWSDGQLGWKRERIRPGAILLQCGGEKCSFPGNGGMLMQLITR